MKKSGFQFVRPYLKKLVFTENNQFDMGEKAIEMQNEVSVEVEKKAEEKKAIVTLNFKVNQGKKDVPFELEAVISAGFKWTAGDEKQIDRMLSVNAPAVLLSYLRPIISQITNSSKFPAYDIPFLNFADKDLLSEKTTD